MSFTCFARRDNVLHVTGGLVKRGDGGWDWGGGDVTALSIVLLTCFAHRDKVHYVTTGTDET